MYATDIQPADLALYPALQCLRRRRAPNTAACAECGAPGRQSDHGIEVELDDLGHVLCQSRKPEHELDERACLGRGRSSEAADETPRLSSENDPLGVHVGDAAGPKGDQRAEDKVMADQTDGLADAVSRRQM
jgi:hypothetical protein